ncbi:MAG TPA: hypothetical protein VM848_07165 [Acidimicrobiia bacterium]|nr:hypothetical protein [Acidimicrobiia bacterium]
MNADFTGESLPLPPGVEIPPRFSLDFPGPVWLSPVASHRLTGLGSTDGHLVVGGRTVWVRSGVAPSAIVASHPNRLGSAEGLAALADLAGQLGATAYVDVDPFLAGVVELPALIAPIVHWPEASTDSVTLAATRARQAADALRRRLAQIPGIAFPIEWPFGRTVTVVLPIPATRVIDALAEAGAGLSAVELWEGGLSLTLGWWHNRRQIDALAAAVAAIVAGCPPAPVPPDRFDRIPDDLPLRRLDTIPFL